MNGIGRKPDELSFRKDDSFAIYRNLADTRFAIKQFAILMQMCLHRPTIMILATEIINTGKILILIFHVLHLTFWLYYALFLLACQRHKPHNKIIKSIKNKYHLPLDKKILLYAPTWRDNSYVASGYTFELQANFKKWKEVLGNEYVVVFKPHYLIINKYENDSELEGFLYSIPASAEINELYVLSDCLVTDYSSVFFDYAVLNRPMYFYMYDLDDYRDELRGFYLDIYTELPGTIYENEENMLMDMHLQLSQQQDRKFQEH